MRERARDKGRLEDIVEYSSNVIELIKGYSFEDLVNDKRTYYSVMKNIEVVGEAAYMLTHTFKKSHPATPWKIVQGMRHVLVHDYATVDDRELYNTAVNDIPILLNQVKQYLAETNWEEWQNGPNDYEDTLDVAHQTSIDHARRMKAKGFSISDISEITGLAPEDIENL